MSVGRADRQQERVVPDTAAHFRVKLCTSEQGEYLWLSGYFRALVTIARHATQRHATQRAAVMEMGPEALYGPF